MRFRLLRRRLTISAPRMAVRSALPWPFRWAVLAIVLGFVLVSYSPPEVLFTVMLVYALSGYYMWFKSNIKKANRAH